MHLGVSTGQGPLPVGSWHVASSLWRLSELNNPDHLMPVGLRARNSPGVLDLSARLAAEEQGSLPSEHLFPFHFNFPLLLNGFNFLLDLL